MKNEQPKPITTEGLKQLQRQAVENRSGVVLTQGVEAELPPRLKSALDRGVPVIIDYTGGITIQGE